MKVLIIEDEAIANVYDIILLDVMLPHKDGFSILKELRREKIEKPVIMLTAKSSDAEYNNDVECKEGVTCFKVIIPIKD